MERLQQVLCISPFRHSFNVVDGQQIVFLKEEGLFCPTFGGSTPWGEVGGPEK